jgi:hypothetical protein
MVRPENISALYDQDQWDSMWQKLNIFFGKPQCTPVPRGMRVIPRHLFVAFSGLLGPRKVKKMPHRGGICKGGQDPVFSSLRHCFPKLHTYVPFCHCVESTAIGIVFFFFLMLGVSITYCMKEPSTYCL